MITQVRIRRAINSKYWLYQKLAQGEYGKVYAAQDLRTGRLVAIKVQVDDESKIARSEYKLLSRVSSPHIVRLIEGFCMRNLIYIVFPLYTCNLQQFLMNKKSVPLHMVIRLAYQLFRAVHECHSKGIIHRDIKPSNIFLKNDRLVLGDFGLATNRRKNHDIEASTLWYRSPEALLNEYNYDEKVDIWAAACVVGEMLTKGVPMFRSNCEIGQVFAIFSALGTPEHLNMIHFRPSFPKWPRKPLRIVGTPTEFTDILQKCLVYSPNQRCSAAQACRAFVSFMQKYAQKSLPQTKHHESKGDPAPAGDQGDQGDQGDRAPTGDQGDQGDKGDQGGRWDQRDRAPTGDQGDQGDRAT